MVRKISILLLTCQTAVIVILSLFLLTPKKALYTLSDILNLKYKIVLVER